MTLLNLVNMVFGVKVKQNDAEIINQAKVSLNEIGSLFRETINNYRKHADVTRSEAEAFEARAMALQLKAQKALENSKELELVADEAEQMAKRIEDSMGGAKFMEVSA